MQVVLWLQGNHLQGEMVIFSVSPKNSQLFLLDIIKHKLVLF